MTMLECMIGGCDREALAQCGDCQRAICGDHVRTVTGPTMCMACAPAPMATTA